MLARTRLRQQSKILGITLPGNKSEFSELSQQIGEAGRQFGKLASEIRAACEKAEQISRAIS